MGFGGGEPRVTTTFDDAGRPLASVYAGGHPDERYVYDADGRLVAIEESPGFTSLAPARWRHYEPVGGQLEVVHDERGPRVLRRADSGLVVWERLDRPWPDTLAAFAQALAEAAVAGLAEACRRDGRGPEEEIFSLALVPYPIALSELHPTCSRAARKIGGGSSPTRTSTSRSTCGGASMRGPRA